MAQRFATGEKMYRIELQCFDWWIIQTGALRRSEAYDKIRQMRLDHPSSDYRIVEIR